MKGHYDHSQVDYPLKFTAGEESHRQRAWKTIRGRAAEECRAKLSVEDFRTGAMVFNALNSAEHAEPEAGEA
jgi:hypothetical protein